MVGPLSFVPVESATVAEVDRLLRDELGCPEPVMTVVHRTFSDTFDGRIFVGGCVLEHEQVRLAAPAETDPAGSLPQPWLRLRPVGAPTATAQASCEQTPARPGQLPAGRLRDEVAALAGPRVLLPIAATVTATRTYRVLGPEEKTVARVVVGEPALVGGAALDPTVTVVPVRGYDRDFERVVAAITSRCGERLATEPFVRAARALGIAPGVDPSDTSVGLDPAASAASAVVALVERLVAVVDLNVDGVTRDLDVEFLHDLRVAVRRARSVLHAARSLFPADQLEPLTGDLRWLGAITTPVRDLDVYLEDLRDSDAGGAGGSGAGDAVGDLAPLCTLLESDRARAQDALVEGLGSERYRAFRERVNRFVRPDAPLTAAPSARAWADEQIDRAHRAVRKAGRAVVSVEDLHDVRKRAKRLRYVLEGARSLYPHRRMDAAVRELKALQDVLGTVQDAEVHIALLLDAGRRLGPVAPDTLMAIGALVEHERSRQRATIERFDRQFRRFRKRWQAP